MDGIHTKWNNQYEQIDKWFTIFSKNGKYKNNKKQGTNKYFRGNKNG